VRCALSSRGRPKSAAAEKLKVEVRELYAQGFNASQIAKLKGFTRSYVSRIVRDLKDSDPEVINAFLRSSPESDVSSGWNKNVHAQRIRAYVHWMSDSYKSAPNKYFKNFVDGVDVGCQGKYIFLRSNKKKFYAGSEQKALWKSLGFWNDVLLKLEDRLGVLIFKKGSQAFEFLYQEWETQDSVVAVDAEKKGHVWRVFHSEDGKLRLSVDWSEGTPNHETHHKRDAHVDSVVFERHVNSILDNPQAPTFAELSQTVQQMAAINKETAQGLKAVVDVMKAQFPQERQVNLEKYDGFYHG
jgi:hypothetical protein